MSAKACDFATKAELRHALTLMSGFVMEATLWVTMMNNPSVGEAARAEQLAKVVKITEEMAERGYVS